MQPTLLKTYKTRKAGKRGLVIALPKEFTTLNNIKPGDPIRVYLLKEDTTLLILQAQKNGNK